MEQSQEQNPDSLAQKCDTNETTADSGADQSASQKPTKRLHKCDKDQIGRLEKELRDCIKASDSTANDNEIAEAYNAVKNGDADCFAVISGEDKPVAFVFCRLHRGKLYIPALAGYEHLDLDEWAGLVRDLIVIYRAQGAKRFRATTINDRTSDILHHCGFTPVSVNYELEV